MQLTSGACDEREKESKSKRERVVIEIQCWSLYKQKDKIYIYYDDSSHKYY